MKRIKKLLCALISAAILLAVCPAVSASEDNLLPSAKDKIAEIMLKYPTGSYFSKDGGPCECHALNKCLENGYNCNCRKYLGAVQCFGFAKYVFYNLFGIDTGTYSSGYILSNSNELNRTMLSSAEVSEQSVKEMLENAKIGDFIQGKSQYSQHSIIIAGFTDGGIITYECNVDKHCGVTSRTLTYAYLASTYYNGISLNSAKNYNYAESDTPEPYDPTDPGNYPVPTRTLYNGLSGEDVMWLQAALNRIGDYKLDIDGIFGPATDSAVRDYQSKNGLTVDGYAGQMTRQSIIDALAEAEKVLLGDIDCNGVIDGLDMLMLTQNFLGITNLTKRQLAAADIDGDKTVGSTDCLMLQQHLLNISPINQESDQ
jgi:hypothetical protein